MDTLRPYVHIVLKRLWLILLLVVVTAGGIYLTMAAQPVAYNATVRLRVTVTETEDVALFSTVRPPAGDQQELRTGVEFIDILRNRDVAWEAAHALNQELGTNVTADWILEAIWPRIEGTTIVVTYRNLPTATLARRMAEVHIQKALDFYRQIRTRTVTLTRTFLEQQLADQAEALNQARQRLRDFLLQHNLADIRREATALQDQVRALQLERDKAQVAAEQAQAIAAAYRREAAALERRAAALADRDPDQAAALRAQAQALAAQALEQEAAAAGHRARVNEYDRLITQYQNRLAELLGLESEYAQLQMDIRLAEDRYTFLADKLAEARTKEQLALETGYLQVVQDGREPVTPVARPVIRYVLYGVFVATLLGIVLALVLELIANLLGRAVPETQPRREPL